MKNCVRNVLKTAKNFMEDFNNKICNIDIMRSITSYSDAQNKLPYSYLTVFNPILEVY